MFPVFSPMRCPKMDMSTFESYDNGTQLRTIQLISKLEQLYITKREGKLKRRFRFEKFLNEKFQ